MEDSDGADPCGPAGFDEPAGGPLTSFDFQPFVTVACRDLNLNFGARVCLRGEKVWPTVSLSVLAGPDSGINLRSESWPGIRVAGGDLEPGHGSRWARAGFRAVE